MKFDLSKLNSEEPDGEELEKLEAYLEKVLREIYLSCIFLAGKPFQMSWDPNSRTASTDRKATVHLSPHFFLEDREREGRGTAGHETGHIRFAKHLKKNWMEMAQKEGGETRAHIFNLVLDRRDDVLLGDFAGGFAKKGFAQTHLRRRLPYICTMHARELWQAEIRAKKQNRPEIKPKRMDALLGNWKPKDVHEDFFYACKWHKRPRTPEVRRIMKWMKIKDMKKMEEPQLFGLAEEIHKRLGEPKREESDKQGSGGAPICITFSQIMQALNRVETGKGGQKIPPIVLSLIRGIEQQFVLSFRKGQIEKLKAKLQQMNSRTIHPGPLSVGLQGSVPFVDESKEKTNGATYQQLLQEMKPQVQKIEKALKQIETPSQFRLYGLDEGDLDLSESARIAVGLPALRTDLVEERDIDAEIVLAIDTSGSMTGDKLIAAKKLAVLFSEAIITMRGCCSGRVVSFNSSAVIDHGPVRHSSTFVDIKTDGGNSDTHMLARSIEWFKNTRHRQKILFSLCDDGPDSIEGVKEITEKLMDKGIIPIHLMTGVVGTPNIYPFELIYYTIQDCVDDFEKFFVFILKHLKH